MSKPSASAVERRASLARLSLRLLFVLVSAAMALILAPAAQAEQLPEVTLTETKPKTTEAAPANWTTPRVMGRKNGGVTSAIRFGSGTRLVHTALVGGGFEVTLYTDSNCTTEIAKGGINELEGEGIEVEVPPDSVTIFYAIQSDPTEVEVPSACSETGLTYWESSTGSTPKEIEEMEEKESPPGGGGGSGSGSPPAAPHLHMLPSGRANDNTPQVTGSAPGAATVRVFGNSSCRGAPVATGSAADFAAGLTVDIGDNTTNTFTAVSVAGGNASVCSAPVTYIEDSSPPQTRITMGPGVKTRRHKAVFRFTDTTDDPPGTTFLCKVDRSKWKRCRSPFKLRHLRFHRHVLRVRAVDVAGNAEAVGAKRRFKVIHRR